MAVTPELIIDCYSYFWSRVPRFLVVLLHLRFKFIGITKFNHHEINSTWITKEIIQKMHEIDYHLRKARLRNAVTKEIRQSKAKSCRKMFRDNIEKPKDFWKQIKRSYPSNEKGQHVICVSC